ncbi:MAG: hypothetical protein ACYS0I_07570 [Planctomycetota bacterium]
MMGKTIEDKIKLIERRKKLKHVMFVNAILGGCFSLFFLVVSGWSATLQIPLTVFLLASSIYLYTWWWLRRQKRQAEKAEQKE